MTTLAVLTADLESYVTYDDPTFVAEIPRFIKSAEEKVFYFVQGLPMFRKAQTGSLTAGNAYLDLPSDFLAASSLAIITSANEYIYLLNKDVEYIREVYPNPTSTGVPFCYALFDLDDLVTTITIGPTPDLSYAVQLNYFYKPPSLVDQPTGTWLSENAYNCLLYGSLSESALWLKKNAGIDNMADSYDQQFLVALQALKNLGESRDRKDTYRSGEKRKAEA